MAAARTPDGVAAKRHYDQACMLGDRIMTAHGEDMPLATGAEMAKLHATLALVRAVQDLRDLLAGET